MEFCRYIFAKKHFDINTIVGKPFSHTSLGRSQTLILKIVLPPDPFEAFLHGSSFAKTALC